MKFHSSAMNASRSMREYTVDQIKNEPMFFSASYAYARTHGGRITNEFLDLLEPDYGHLLDDKLVIDSRVHMLMPGWYPCIPGWHHDDVPRTRRDKQPNYRNPAYQSKHFAVVVGDCSLTEFLFGRISLDIPKLGHTIYKDWNNELNLMIKMGKLKPQPVVPGLPIYFDWQTFHRGMPATKSGWRMFIRASWDTDRPKLNEIRKQTQVYMSELEAGW